jgi:hypothetical protein
MSYMGGKGNRANEYASKSAHSHVIRDPDVQKFLQQYELPKNSADISIENYEVFSVEKIQQNPIKNVIAFDGGFQEIIVRSEFPSSILCFFQFGALIFRIKHLEELEEKPFIDPEDMAKLKKLNRLKLVLPIKNLSIKTEPTLTSSIRKVLFDFFAQNGEKGTFLETLFWFIFEEYNGCKSEYSLASHPCADISNVFLKKSEMKSNYTWDTPEGTIYLTDVFRLHEAVDDELGAGGILSYVMTTIEQIFLVHYIRLILEISPDLINDIIFIKDGPLAFFGQTANMHKPMKSLIKYLINNHNIYIAGLEKSGAFVDHAHEVASQLKPGTALILNNEYIYRFIIPGKADPNNLYGRTTYYGQKIIFKTEKGGVYVVTVPVPELIEKPTKKDLKNIDVILFNIAKLKCDMYDNALVPVALANKLVSLSNHPSSQILKRFAMDAVNKT